MHLNGREFVSANITDLLDTAQERNALSVLATKKDTCLQSVSSLGC